MNIEQIKSILDRVEESLRLLQQQPEYHRIERKISTPIILFWQVQFKLCLKGVAESRYEYCRNGNILKF